MKRTLSAAAIVLGALWFGPTPGFATPTTEIKGTYTISESFSQANGGAAINALFGTDQSSTSTSVTNRFDIFLGVGSSFVSAGNLASFTPDANCAGSDCSQVGNGLQQHPRAAGTYTDTGINITWTFTLPNSKTLMDSATYTAKYSGTALACAGGLPTGTNVESDCIDWGTSPISVDFGTQTLAIQMNNAQDWTITPTIAFQLTNDAPVTTAAPEPAGLAVLGMGLVALGVVRRQRRVAVATVTA
jgi:hypothetical protein